MVNTHTQFLLEYNQITWVNSTLLAKYIDCNTANPKVLHMAGVWLDLGNTSGFR